MKPPATIVPLGREDPLPAWSSRISGEIGTAAAIMPGGFSCYLHIMHPGYTTGYRRVAGEELAEHRGGPYKITPPRVGSLEEEDWAVLAGALQDGMKGPVVSVAIWAGNVGPAGAQESSLRLGVSMRSYVILQVSGLVELAALPALLQEEGWLRSDDFQTPNFVWQPDEEWIVATEVDFDSTFVASSNQMCSLVQQIPELEVSSLDLEKVVRSFYVRR